MLIFMQLLDLCAKKRRICSHLCKLFNEHPSFSWGKNIAPPPPPSSQHRHVIEQLFCACVYPAVRSHIASIVNESLWLSFTRPIHTVVFVYPTAAALPSVTPSVPHHILYHEAQTQLSPQC